MPRYQHSKPVAPEPDFDKILADAERRPDPTQDEWCAMGVCPECVHDLATCKDGQFCPECGYYTELSYLTPAERDQ